MSLLFNMDALTTLLASVLSPLIVNGFIWKYGPVKYTNLRNHRLFTLFVGLCIFFILFFLIRSREVEPIMKAVYSFGLSMMFRFTELFQLVIHEGN